MQIEVAGVATLTREECLVVLEVFPDASIAGIDLVIFLHDTVEDGIVAVQSVQPFLQVHGSIVGTGTVPDRIVQENLAARHPFDERINDLLHVGTIGVG